MQDGNVLAREEMILRGTGQTAVAIRFENRLLKHVGFKDRLGKDRVDVLKDSPLKDSLGIGDSATG